MPSRIDIPLSGSAPGNGSAGLDGDVPRNAALAVRMLRYERVLVLDKQTGRPQEGPVMVGGKPLRNPEYIFSANSITYNISCTKLMVQAGKSRRMEPRKIVPFGAFPVYSSASRRACTAALQRVGTSSIVMRPVLIMR